VNKENIFTICSSSSKGKRRAIPRQRTPDVSTDVDTPNRVDASSRFVPFVTLSKNSDLESVRFFSPFGCSQLILIFNSDHEAF
jgi:hypothetical protein